MRPPNPERRISALRDFLNTGTPDKTKQGVPVLRLAGMTACYFGRSEKFRLFDDNYIKLADFDDTEEGRQALADFIKER